MQIFTETATHIGSTHLKKGLPNQDRVRAVTYPDGTTVVIVSDGNGNGKSSQIGAETAIELLPDIFWKAARGVSLCEINLKLVERSYLRIIRTRINQRLAVGGMKPSHPDYRRAFVAIVRNECLTTSLVKIVRPHTNEYAIIFDTDGVFAVDNVNTPFGTGIPAYLQYRLILDEFARRARDDPEEFEQWLDLARNARLDFAEYGQLDDKKVLKIGSDGARRLFNPEINIPQGSWQSALDEATRRFPDTFKDDYSVGVTWVKP